MTAPAPLVETRRSAAVDAVRGLAVLGILAMNIVEFGLPMRAYDDPAAAGGATGADLGVWLLQQALFDGRMRALFSMLFGAGLVYVHRRLAAEGRGDAAADLLLRRCLWLIPFGIAHRFLLQWTGDILYTYGVLGLGAVALRAARPRAQLVAGILCLAAFVPIEWRKYDQGALLRADAATAVQLAEAHAEVPAELAAARARWERRTTAPAADANDAEIAAIRGSWVDVARHRWDHNHSFQSAFVYYYFVWDVFGMFLVGMALAQWGFFTGAWSSRAYVVTFAVGVAADAVSWWLAGRWADTGFSHGELGVQFARGASYPFLRGLGGLGWAALVVLLLRSPAAVLCAPLVAVGRLAFSNYVLQTVCATLVFFGYGFGCYGAWSRSGVMLVCLGITAVQIVWSMWWLRRHRIGPLEWCWRTLTYGRRPAMRRGGPDDRG